MADFLKAAFPWVAMGIAVALFAANHARNKKRAEENKNDADNAPQTKDKDYPNYMCEGMSLGMCFGLLLGTTGACDLGTGISLGMLLGMVVGMNVKK